MLVTTRNGVITTVSRVNPQSAVKAHSQGAIATAIYFSQLMGCLGFSGNRKMCVTDSERIDRSLNGFIF